MVYRGLPASHIAAMQRYKRDKVKQQTLTAVGVSAGSAATFYADLCKALLSANIPLWKLQNPTFAHFLAEYTKKHIPDESTLRKNYVNRVYEDTVAEIRRRVADNFCFVVVDETTDVRGNYVAHLLLGTLGPSVVGSPFLIASSQLEKTNAATISTFVNNALIQFYEGKPFSDKLLLLVSDAAPCT